MTLRFRSFAVILALMAAGCGTVLTPGSTSAPSPSELRQASDPLTYFRLLLQMAPDEQRSEHQAALARHDANSTDENRIRLVLTLLIPEAPWRDDAWVSRLLAADASLQPGTQNPYGDLAFLLERLLGERMRLLREESRKLEAAQQRMASLREENRKLEALKQKMDAMNEECRKAEDLQKKLEGLREIDRELRKRPGRSTTP